MFIRFAYYWSVFAASANIGALAVSLATERYDLLPWNVVAAFVAAWYGRDFYRWMEAERKGGA